jgi:hypothetical protein
VVLNRMAPKQQPPATVSRDSAEAIAATIPTKRCRRPDHFGGGTRIMRFSVADLQLKRAPHAGNGWSGDIPPAGPSAEDWRSPARESGAAPLSSDVPLLADRGCPDRRCTDRRCIESPPAVGSITQPPPSRSSLRP